MDIDLKTEYQKLNADIWGDINEYLTDKSSVISHEDYLAAKSGELKVSLAGINTVPTEWFPELKGRRILCLASGGGQQGPVFAAHGANVTVTDLSDGQLMKEKYASEREGYEINIVKADLSKPFPFEDETFDMIFNPISNCYIEDISLMQKECSRVIKKGGILMLAYVKEELFMFYPDFAKEDKLISRFSLPFNSLRDLSKEQKEERLIEKCHLTLAIV